MWKPALFAAAILLAGINGTLSASEDNKDSAEATPSLVVSDITLVDGRTGSKTSGVTIVVEGDRIVAVGEMPDSLPESACAIDGSNKWVVPGLIDIHVHDASQAYLRDMLAWGVTAVHLMPNFPPDEPVSMERRAELAQTPTPRLQVTEMFAGAFPDNQLPGVYRFIKPETADEARRAVQDSYDRGYRQIKIIRDDSSLWSDKAYHVPLMPEPVYKALIDQAHSLDMSIYVHAAQREVARTALSSGAGAFIHAVMDEDLNARDIQMLAAAKSVWAPTLHAIYWFGDHRSYAQRILAEQRYVALLEENELAEWRRLASSEEPVVQPPMIYLVANTDEYVAIAAENTRLALEGGVPVAVGTDGGPGGISTHIELELLQAGGLTPSEVLVAATHGGAVALGRQSDLGTIEVGKLADMVILNADPTVDVRNSREIEWVIKGGRAYRPNDLALGD